jgi:hypothetical protein
MGEGAFGWVCLRLQHITAFGNWPVSAYGSCAMQTLVRQRRLNIMQVLCTAGEVVAFWVRGGTPRMVSAGLSA